MATIRELIDDKVHEVFYEHQKANNITSGDISPLDELELDELEDALANCIERICAKQSKKINYNDFTPSWYIYTDCDREAHDIVYGHNDTNQFFRDVSERICFSDCSDETVQKIYYKGKEVRYVGWQHGMKFEYKDLDGETVWVGYFPEWDH